MKMLFSKDLVFKDLVAKLDYFGAGFLALVDGQDGLIGILTDGDIRRAILNDVQDIELILNKSPVTVPQGTPKAQIISLLKDIQRRHMPIVDADGKLIDVVSLDAVDFNRKPNQVIIMAGGLGTRLGDLTKDTPKPMLHVGEKPMIVRIVESFKDYGYTNFTISVNFESEKIKNYFKDGADLGVKVDYIEETKQLGTAGALSLMGNVNSHPCFVINGDVLTTLNFKDLMEFHVNSLASATMCVREHETEVPFGVVNVDINNNIVGLQEKPKVKFLVNTGIYVLNPEVLEYIPSDEYFGMPSLFEVLIGKGLPTKTYKIVDYWVDVGSVSAFEEANEKYHSNNI